MLNYGLMLREQAIFDANIKIHSVEAPIYDLIHTEIYGSSEQKRLIKRLKSAQCLIEKNEKTALDFGAGTGNVTGKLLDLGYNVIAVDISPDMCRQLGFKYKKALIEQRLKIINTKIEDFNYEHTFDLITCYSVLHHLPNYLFALERLCGLLKQGGVLFLDHEPSPYFWSSNNKKAITIPYRGFNLVYNKLYFTLNGIKIPPLDYELSDYWTSKDRHVDHEALKHLFEASGFRYYRRIDYHLNRCFYPNPFLPIYKKITMPDFSYWIAKL